MRVRGSFRTRQSLASPTLFVALETVTDRFTNPHDYFTLLQILDE